MESAAAIPPPRFVFLQVNKRCNLRCQHCDFWKRDDTDQVRYLTLDQLHAILSEFAGMNDRGAVVICGGEPMLDLERYFGLAASCRSLGLRCLSVVNGTRIRSPRMAQRMIEEGPHEISISLNSHRASLHDRTRGVEGAFDKAVAALRLLLDARRSHGSSDTKIHVMGLIFGDNYREIDAFYDFVLNEVGADKLKLNFLQPSFGQEDAHDPFFAEQGDVDPDEIVDIIARCEKKHDLRVNPVWLRQVGMYFRSLRAARDRHAGWRATSRTSEHICNTYERNVMIDHYGVARLCFSHVFPGKLLARPGDFRSFWENSTAIRNRMRRCNRFCGISHSVRRECTTLEGMDKAREHEARFGKMPPASPFAAIVSGVRSLVDQA